MKKKGAAIKRRLPIAGVLSLLFFLPCFFTVSAQGGLVNTAFYSINEGLSDRLVKEIIQDKQGFLWLATARGLNRFDGYQFSVFDHLPDTEFKISHSDVASLALNCHNDLVIIYRNNYTDFDLLDLNTYQVKKVSLLPESGISGIVRRIHVSPQGEVYILANENTGINIYNYHEESGMRLVTHLEEAREKQATVVHFIQTRTGDFLVNDNVTGLKLIDTLGNLKQEFDLSFFYKDHEEVVFPGEPRVFHQDKQGRIWLSFQKGPGLFLFNPVEEGFFEVIQPDFASNQKFYPNLWEDKSGNLLIGESEALALYPSMEKILCFQPDGLVIDFSHLVDPGFRVTNIFSENFFNTIFLGLDTGLRVIQNNHSKIKNYLNVQAHEGLRGPLMRGITGNGKDKVYIARETNDWYILDLNTHFLDTLQIVNEFGEAIPLGCSMNLILDEEGYLWGSSCQAYQGSNLIKYDTANCYARTFHFQYDIDYITLGLDGKLWITAHWSENQEDQSCVASFDPMSEQFQIFTDKDGNNPLEGNRTRCITQASDGLLWVGTENGLFKINEQTGDIEVIRMDLEQANTKNQLGSNTIYIIHENEADNKLWLGTTNGLSIIDPQTGDITNINDQDGLASNVIAGILPDGQGNFWISTFNGLSFYSPKYGSFRNFYHSDGFTHDEFNRTSHYMDHRGRLYFGGVNGFNAFYPSDLIVATSTPSLSLTKITRFNPKESKPVHKTTGLQNLEVLEIGPNDTYFQIHYMLPVFSKTNKNQFRAWLEGSDPEWTYLGNTPYVRYNGLPAGNYTLHLNGADPTGNWGDTPIQLKIHVQQIFYKTTWFRLLIILAIITLGFGLFRYQLDQQLKVERLRTRLSSDIHDEVSGLLSGIAMQADVLREVSKENYVQEKLKNIGEASRKAMSKMSDIIWSTDSRKDRMSDLIERMREHADEILLKLNIQYDFRVEKVDKTKKIPVAIRQNLYFIYKEAINNVAKHADTNQVKIRLINQGNNFQMLVHNNGQAKNNQLKKTGQGLTNIKMRAQRINAHVDINNHKGFTVKISMKKFS